MDGADTGLHGNGGQMDLPPIPISLRAGWMDLAANADLAAMRRYRLQRIQAELKRNDLAGIVLMDPLNIRYATGTSNMQVWVLHNAARACFVPVEGLVTLWDFHNCAHISSGIPEIGDVRTARGVYYFGAGPRLREYCADFANEIAELARKAGGARIAVDHCHHYAIVEMERLGLTVEDGQGPMELARAIKSADEILCMRQAIAVCEYGMERMRETLRPGLTENAFWSILHQTNIALGGEWIETRILASGSRTNPWFQECSDRVIGAGELVSYDTDLIGPYGFCADLSRSYFCGPGKPTETQKTLYTTALEQIRTNMDLMKPGMSFREFSEKSFLLPKPYRKNRYSAVAHGVGQCDEWPLIVYAQDWEKAGYDGIIEPGMCLCIESYVGDEAGGEGVKLENQVLVTETGIALLSQFPFEDDLIL